MAAQIDLKAIDRVEILTLQDNYIDLLAQDSNEVVQRAMPLKGDEIKNSLLAEHGLSILITINQADAARTLLFDFGFSEHGAAFNAEALDVDLTIVEALALSHGHLDHMGGMKKLVEKIGKSTIPLVLHPQVFRNPRFLKARNGVKAYFPPFTMEDIEASGVTPVETTQPYPMLDGAAIFLGQIPRVTAFEQGAPNLFYEEEGIEKQDLIEDDTAVVFNLKDKGLVIISGCAHSGIVNTVTHAIDVTGIERVWAIMGGFHLSGADVDSVIQPTVDALKQLNPRYIIPTHCTGRQAVMEIEKQMPECFIMNMAGTKLTFAA
ncbi:MAG: MBL fold metallo-hydrolase [Desulfobacteraceae bacterium]|jgi:7,8-dihydropterin-6-yl-methyl-4-(beta-D-ribofuranosyl)aminobenzene 5'-phosphate synthase